MKINYPFVCILKLTNLLLIFNIYYIDGFKTFPQLTQLDLSFNQIKNIKLNPNDYETLEVNFHFSFTLQSLIVFT